MWITFPSGPDPATNQGPSQNGQTNINGTELNATSQTPNTRLPDPVIDPALLELPAVLPTPRQSVTPAPTGQRSTAPRPRARPKGKAATVGIRPAQAPLIIPGEPGSLVPSIDPVVRQHVTGTGTHTHAPTTVGQSLLPSGTVPPIISGSHSIQQTQAMEPASISAAQRKRTITADELAAEEAARIGSTSGKRQRRPAAKVK